jgi:hypothetical protein
MTSTETPPERDAVAAAPAAAKPTERATALLEWLTQRRAIREAKARSGMSEAVADALRRARKALLEGERWLDPPDGSARDCELGLTMLRAGAYWLVIAGAGRAVPEGSLDERLAVLSDADATSGFAAWVLANPPPAALSGSPAAFATHNAEEQARGVAAAQRWVRGLLAAVERRYAALTRLQRQRGLRLGGVLLPLAALLIVATFATAKAIVGPDLAAGKPWRTSSTQEICNPDKGLCGGAPTYIFFQTREEANPWYEVDLVTPKRVHRVEIVNRRDTGQDRALPLVVEVSLDGKRYFKVAERTEPFSTWNATFEPVETRYVRVSVAKQSILHLERVSVR